MKKLYRFSALIFLCFLLLFICSNSNAQNKQADMLQTADSLFALKNWKAAKPLYESYLKDTSVNCIGWNRLGYCNQNLGLYNEALKNYQTALANKPSPPVRGSASARMARIYSLQNKTADAAGWLVQAAATGYNILPDIDTLADFKNVRQAANYNDIKKRVYETVYPCAAEPHTHDFDFWIGEWNVYKTGTKYQVGYSSVQSIAGSCAILENWTSTGSNSGKSFNYYDPTTGKWEQDWLGSGGTADRQRFYNGEYKNGVMSFTSESTTPRGDKVKGNFRFYNIDKETVRQYFETSTDNGKTFTPSYDFTYVRKK